MVKRIIFRTVFLLSTLHDLVMLRLATKRQAAGVTIADFTLDGREAHGDAIHKVAAAVRFLAAWDSRRASRVRRELRAIAFDFAPGARGRFRPGSRVCLLDIDNIESRDPRETAATIVHEATHALLWRRGFRYDQNIRSRVERICRKEELRFVKQVPGLHRFETELEAVTSHEDDSPILTIMTHPPAG